MNIYNITDSFGKNAASRIAAAKEPGINGALACIESFYYAFNNRDIKVFSQVWHNHSQIQLNNPLGGIIFGKSSITRLYEKIFTGPAEVWVTFSHIVVFETPKMITFAGQENGAFHKAEKELSLKIRTTRIVSYHEEAQQWGMVHHHGSIDDPHLLAQYQAAVNNIS